MTYLALYWECFKVGLFCVGGGYAALPLIQASIVERLGWLTMTEFTDIVTISQMTPGPIGINAATFVGTKVAGAGGSLAATFGLVTPSFCIMLALAWLYSKYNDLPVIQDVLKAMRPCAIGLISASAVSIAINTFWGEDASLASLMRLEGIADINLAAVGVFLASLIVILKLRVHQAAVLLGAGALGLAMFYLQ